MQTKDARQFHRFHVFNNVAPPADRAGRTDLCKQVTVFSPSFQVAFSVAGRFRGPHESLRRGSSCNFQAYLGELSMPQLAAPLRKICAGS